MVRWSLFLSGVGGGGNRELGIQEPITVVGLLLAKVYLWYGYTSCAEFGC